MKLIVGLGNPGPQYEKTRHNAGFMAVDRLARRHAPSELVRSRFSAACIETPIAGERCLLMKPTTYMNRSGLSVAEAVRFYKVSIPGDLLVLVDDLAFAVGVVRVRAGGGAGGHNGLADIQRALGTEEYPRVRIGIDPCPAYMDQADYVLGRFTPEQESLLAPAIDRAADAAETFISRGLAAAMNSINAPPATPRPSNPEPKTQNSAQQG